MNRRESTKAMFVFGGNALAFPHAVFAQVPTRKIPRVGIVWHAGSPEQEQPFFGAFLQGMADLGYVDGRNIILEHRFGNEKQERFKSMAAELVESKVDVLIFVGSATVPHIKGATTSIPVIFVFAPDPVGSKLVDTLGRPGGNITGLSNISADLTGKRIQFLKEAIPQLSRAAFLLDPRHVLPAFIKEAEQAAAQQKITLRVFEVRAVGDFKPAFDAMVKERMQAVTWYSGGLVHVERATIAKLALERNLPSCAASRTGAEAGAMMSFGTDAVALIRGAPVYLDKILKGAKPADLPVQQPTKFELVINARVAKSLKINIPQSLLLVADSVIE